MHILGRLLCPHTVCIMLFHRMIIKIMLSNIVSDVFFFSLVDGMVLFYRTRLGWRFYIKLPSIPLLLLMSWSSSHLEHTLLNAFNKTLEWKANDTNTLNVYTSVLSVDILLGNTSHRANLTREQKLLLWRRGSCGEGSPWWREEEFLLRSTTLPSCSSLFIALLYKKYVYFAPSHNII